MDRLGSLKGDGWPSVGLEARAKEKKGLVAIL